MKIVFKGKYSGSPADIPNEGHRPNAVMFKEPDMNKMALVMNIAAFIVTAVLLVATFVRAKGIDRSDGLQIIIGAVCSMLVLFPHELLHAICFKKTAYVYTNLRQGMLFVTGGEDMSKARFVIMSLLPNIVFGFVPLILYTAIPTYTALGVFGSICIGQGAGDYLNVYNALTQMPKGSKTYLYETHSYWYMPEDNNQ